MQDKTPLTAGEEGLKDIKLIMAAYESAATGKTIKFT
jgi:predicted dehydrogenase